MSADQQPRQVLERVSEEVARLVADERAQAARAGEEARRKAEAEFAALQAEAAEAKRQADMQLAEVRSQAESQVADARRRAEQEIADAKRTADAQVAEARKQGEAQAAEIRRQAEIQLAQLRENANRQVEELRRSAESQIADMKRTLDEVRATSRQQIEEARRAANAEAEDLVISQLATAAVDNDARTKAEVERVEAQGRAEAVAQARRLAESIHALDQARSLGELLDYLAQCAAHEVERAAVLVRRGSRLQGWRLVGFGGAAPAAKSIDLDLGAAGIAGDAAVVAAPVSEGAAPSFALTASGLDTTARIAHALPILVGGDVVAVLYADTSSTAQPADRWRPVLDVLASHVSRALEAMTVQQAAGLPLPRPMARASQHMPAGQEYGHIQ